MHLLYDNDINSPTQGKITGTYLVPDNLLALAISTLPSGVGLYSLLDTDQEWSAENFYINDNSLLPRPEITATVDKTEIAANDADTATISGLPIPCTATLDSAGSEILDGVVEFKTDFPGTYKVEITAFPHKAKTFEVVAI